MCVWQLGEVLALLDGGAACPGGPACPVTRIMLDNMAKYDDSLPGGVCCSTRCLSMSVIFEHLSA